jgi:hypothetical protein
MEYALDICLFSRRRSTKDPTSIWLSRRDIVGTEYDALPILRPGFASHYHLLVKRRKTRIQKNNRVNVRRMLRWKPKSFAKHFHGAATPRRRRRRLLLAFWKEQQPHHFPQFHCILQHCPVKLQESRVIHRNNHFT